MSDHISKPAPFSTHWQAILSLGILNAVFTFSNLAYHENQGIILQKHGLEHFNHFLETVGLVLTCIIPPLAGWLSDRYAISHGKRFLVISVAVVITSLLFMTVALGYSLESGVGFAQILPYAMLFWVTGMLFFHSPTHSFVTEYAPKKQWPLANAIILLVAGLISAGKIFIMPVMETFGVAPTFISGGVLLAASTWWFVKSSSDSVHPVNDAQFSVGRWWGPFLYGGLTGLAVFLFEFLLRGIPNSTLFMGLDNEYLRPMMLAVMAIIGILLGRYAEKMGTQQMFQMALPAFAILIAISPWIMEFIPGWVYLVLLMLSFSALQICGLPMALDYVEKGNKGFSVGVYWAGFNLILALGLWFG